MTNQIPEI